MFYRDQIDCLSSARQKQLNNCTYLSYDDFSDVTITQEWLQMNTAHSINLLEEIIHESSTVKNAVVHKLHIRLWVNASAMTTSTPTPTWASRQQVLNNQKCPTSSLRESLAAADGSRFTQQEWIFQSKCVRRAPGGISVAPVTLQSHFPLLPRALDTDTHNTSTVSHFTYVLQENPYLGFWFQNGTFILMCYHFFIIIRIRMNNYL